MTRGADTAHRQRRAHRFLEETVRVAAPVRTVYDHWTRFDTFPRFMPSIREVTQLRPTLTRWVVGGGPLHREFHAEIVEQHPDSHVRWRCLDRHFPHEGEASFHADGGDACVVSLSMATPLEAPRAIVRPVVTLVARTVRTELIHFRDFVEGMGEPGETWRGTIHDGRVLHIEKDAPAVPGWQHG